MKQNIHYHTLDTGEEKLMFDKIIFEKKNWIVYQGNWWRYSPTLAFYGNFKVEFKINNGNHAFYKDLCK